MEHWFGRQIRAILTWFGVSRFFVEFIRLNPFDYFGMSSSQLVSILFVISGVIILLTSKHRKEHLQ